MTGPKNTLTGCGLAMPDLSAYLTVRDAAQLLGVSRQRIYRLVAKKQLPAVRVGRHYRVWLIHEDLLRAPVELP